MLDESLYVYNIENKIISDSLENLLETFLTKKTKRKNV